MKKVIITLVISFLLVLGSLNCQTFSEITNSGWGRTSLFNEFKMLDLDNDGLLDVLNKSTHPVDHWEQVTPASFELEIVERNFQDGLDNGRVPVFSDLDNDGLREMIHSDGWNYGNWIIKEEVTVNSLDFVLVNDDITEENWRGMSNFVDMDNNGLYECVILTFQNGEGSFYHIYEQVTADSFELQRVQEDIFPDISNHFIPQIIDIDNNGLFDIVVQSTTPDFIEIKRFEQESENSLELNLIDDNFLNINQYLTPEVEFFYSGENLFAVDFNHNGLLNYILRHPGEEERIFVLEQTEADSDEFQMIDESIVEFSDISGANPIFSDLDSDGFLEMFTTSNPSIHLYGQNNLGSAQFDLFEEQFNEIESAQLLKFFDFDEDGYLA